MSDLEIDLNHAEDGVMLTIQSITTSTLFHFYLKLVLEILKSWHNFQIFNLLIQLFICTSNYNHPLVALVYIKIIGKAYFLKTILLTSIHILVKNYIGFFQFKMTANILKENGFFLNSVFIKSR